MTATPEAELDEFFIGALWQTGKGVGLSDAELLETLRETYGDLAERAFALACEMFDETLAQPAPRRDPARSSL